MTANDKHSHIAAGESNDLPEDAFALSFSICFTWGYPDYMREALNFVVRTQYRTEPHNYICTTWKELRIIIEAADSRETRYIVAGSPETPQAVLDYLSKLGDAEIARRVAENSRAHRKTLARLSYHNCADVRIAVAENPSTAETTLAKLSQDENTDVRYAMAHNIRMPEAILRRLVDDENPYVGARAAQTLERRAGTQIVSANFARKTLQKIRTLKG